MFYGLDALVQFGTAFQHQRVKTVAGQQQRSEKPRRAKTDDDRAAF